VITLEFIEAIDRSDSTCVRYVKNELAWACLSDEEGHFHQSSTNATNVTFKLSNFILYTELKYKL
jgi:hypothetical protein